jgi:hypothetical protein
MQEVVGMIIIDTEVGLISSCNFIQDRPKQNFL